MGVGIPLGIVVHGILCQKLVQEGGQYRRAYSVQDENGILGNEASTVGEILRVDMRSTKPEWIVATFNFLEIEFNTRLKMLARRHPL